MRLTRRLFLCGCVVVLFGCQAASVPSEQEEMMKAVGGSLKGRPLSDEEFQYLKKEVSQGGEAQQSVQSIAESITAPNVIKYCPVDGKRFASHLTQCPEHHVPLKELTP
jgi:hypothetical protein